ncbi:hypothetical protein COL940_006726 [Colletotrichum noveboracense]|nr:hypothetical protein COL940_006726 [Colletotrichum noveboracense]KAJ0287249.1 hypothetical protein CBS470a_005432 [Colletotrichum nupharicola]
MVLGKLTLVLAGAYAVTKMLDKEKEFPTRLPERPSNRGRRSLHYRDGYNSSSSGSSSGRNYSRDRDSRRNSRRYH